MKTPRKRKQRPYQRSARIHNMYEKRTPTETIDHTYHRDSIIHSLMTEAPRCRICDRLPTTLGDFIHSQFQSFYKCETCFSVFPHFLTQETDYKTWMMYNFLPKRKNTKSK